jgi:pimeloyl-ACP methyl ester carboxylesterase
MKHQQVKIGSRQIKYCHLGQGNAETIFFMHGFGAMPEAYGTLLCSLSSKYEVIAPLMYGRNYFSIQPTTLEQYKELSHDFISSFKVSKSHLVGHSMGGGIAFMLASSTNIAKSVVGLSPLLPVSYGFVNFSLRHFLIRFNQFSLRAGDNLEEKLKAQKYAVLNFFPYLFNLNKKPFQTISLIKSISKFSLNNLNFSVPTLILYPERDEFFSLSSENKNKMQQVMKNLQLKTLPQKIHEWPMFDHQRCEQEIITFIKDI